MTARARRCFHGAGWRSWCVPWRIPTVPSLLRRRKLQLPGGRCYLPSGLVLPMTGLDDSPLCSESLLPGCPFPSISCIEIRVEFWGYWPYMGEMETQFSAQSRKQPKQPKRLMFFWFFSLAFSHLWWWQITQNHGCALKGRGQPASGRRQEGGLQWWQLPWQSRHGCPSVGRTFKDSLERGQEAPAALWVCLGSSRRWQGQGGGYLLPPPQHLLQPLQPIFPALGAAGGAQTSWGACREPHKVPWLMSVPPILKVCVGK